MIVHCTSVIIARGGFKLKVTVVSSNKNFNYRKCPGTPIFKYLYFRFRLLTSTKIMVDMGCIEPRCRMITKVKILNLQFPRLTRS